MVYRPQLETLESRIVLDSAWHNASFPCDVDGSGLVSAMDALLVVNALNGQGAGPLGVLNATSAMVDVNADDFLSPIDALLVINLINGYSQPMAIEIDWGALDTNGNGVILRNSGELEGTTLPEATVSVGTNFGTTTVRADQQGNFRFVAEFVDGANTIEFTSTDPRGRTITLSESIQLGDISHDWNATVLNVVRAWTATSDDPYQGRIVTSEPPRVARNMAMIHAAMFDAINAIQGGYSTYLDALPTPPENTSATAAGASAAYTVAASLYGDSDELAYWHATLSESLHLVGDAESRENGVVFGRSVGQAMLESRASDGSRDMQEYNAGNLPGDWNRTYPDYNPPLLPQWPSVETFVVDSVVDLRPPAPPSPKSSEYAEAVDEVMRLGELSSLTRTAEQTEIAIFWADGGGTATPPGHWNRIASSVSVERDQSLLENSRMFALLNLALADAGIASWDAKYGYELWRPIDAIRQAEQDGNAATVADVSWLPLLRTPPFPTYTSGHSTFSGAADAVLTALLGDDVYFESTTDPQNAPSQRPLSPDKIVTRSFSSFHDAAEEAGLSRIYGGIHFNFDNVEGLKAGRAIGQFVVDNALRHIT